MLHFQLEGSEEEALDAYSGGLISKNAFYYERGRISDTEMKHFEQQVAAMCIRDRAYRPQSVRATEVEPTTQQTNDQSEEDGMPSGRFPGGCPDPFGY